jgi:hypothetical protein
MSTPLFDRRTAIAFGIAGKKQHTMNFHAAPIRAAGLAAPDREYREDRIRAASL